MSKLLRIAIIPIVCAVLSFNVAAQSRRTFIALTEDFSTLWYVDEAIQKKPAGIVAAWMKSVRSDKSYSLGLSEWNCAAKKKRTMQVQDYDALGVPVSRSTTPLPWRYIVPDSVEDKAAKIVCDDFAGRRSPKRNNSDPTAEFISAQVIVKSTNLLSKPDLNSEVIRGASFGDKFIRISNQRFGDWYFVIDLQTDSLGWLLAQDVRIVDAAKPVGKEKVRTGKGRGGRTQ